MKKLAGVYESTKKDGSTYYRSSLTYNRKHISLGSYENPLHAHEAYLEANRLLRCEPVSIEHAEYSFLAFDKVVSLVNFRDNGLYIGTPIYLYPKFFFYYLSAEHILIFDIDDLFYYSKHKIMKRGGHLFVADYGMQFNILNRYGIKSYAVKDRDYCFRNGDCNDFRYENIEVINRYYGVQRIIKKEKIKYKVKIHINGDFVVGTYDTEEEAAIAYNKAVDLLKSKGSTKNYPVNYLESFSPSQYADIYSKLILSKKLINITFE